MINHDSVVVCIVIVRIVIVVVVGDFGGIGSGRPTGSSTHYPSAFMVNLRLGGFVMADSRIAEPKPFAKFQCLKPKCTHKCQDTQMSDSIMFCAILVSDDRH